MRILAISHSDHNPSLYRTDVSSCSFNWIGIITSIKKKHWIFKSSSPKIQVRYRSYHPDGRDMSPNDRDRIVWVFPCDVERIKVASWSECIQAIAKEASS